MLKRKQTYPTNLIYRRRFPLLKRANMFIIEKLSEIIRQREMQRNFTGLVVRRVSSILANVTEESAKVLLKHATCDRLQRSRKGCRSSTVWQRILPSYVQIAIE